MRWIALLSGGDPVSTQKFTSFVELQIEEGPIPQAEGKTVGVVDSGQGVLWYDSKITGFESHAGSTPMLLRRSTLATQSEIVLAVERERIYSESRRRLSSMS